MDSTRPRIRRDRALLSRDDIVWIQDRKRRERRCVVLVCLGTAILLWHTAAILGWY